LAGACGSRSAFAAKPGLQSGRYQQIINSFLKVNEEEPFYNLRVPGFDVAQGERCLRTLETRPPHEVCEAEVAETPDLLGRVQEGARNQEWSEAYARHPAVVSAPEGEAVLPLALYVDAVPFTKKDGFLAFWLYNLISWKRHLLVVLRKSETCSCGCRKWCTLWEIFRCLAWSFGALCQGKSPDRRHDGQEWEPQDYVRIAKSGEPTVRGALILIKGDWAEFTLTFGFPTWASAQSPCMFCTCTRETMYTIDGLTVGTFPHGLKTDEAYGAACQKCERWITISREEHKQIVESLAYDKRKDPIEKKTFPPRFFPTRNA
jgi:hypothetical protein